MADEWVQIRARLPKDGKTISIVNWLCKHKPFQAWLGVPIEDLNRNALIGVTIKALIEVWAVGNSRGVPDGDDVLLLYTDFEAVDEIAEVPGFSGAMKFVHWAHLEEWNGISSVRLPNFVEYNKPAESRSEGEKRKREQNRIRQKRFRDRHNASNGGDNANNALREEKSREEDSTATATVTGIEDRGTGGRRSGANPEQGNPDPARAMRPKPQSRFKGVPVPGGFQSRLDAIVSALDLAELTDEWNDQIGFLAMLAYADASGFQWPPDKHGAERNLWTLVNSAKVARRRRRNPNRNSAAYLTRLLKDDLGADRWAEFQATYPNGAHCQWLLQELYAGRIQEATE